MMARNSSENYLDNIIARLKHEINHDINLLYIIPCVYTRNLVLNHLRDRLALLDSITEAAAQQMQAQAQLQSQATFVKPAAAFAQLQSASNQTPAELIPASLSAMLPTMPAQPLSSPAGLTATPAQPAAVPAQMPAAVQHTAQMNQATFTPQELAQYNGKNGNPAYVAVNGTVYDVTDNATWAAASHFGLTAGNDLSGAFASCHAGQPVLNKLKVVGKLVQNG